MSTYRALRDVAERFDAESRCQTNMLVRETLAFAAWYARSEADDHRVREYLWKVVDAVVKVGDLARDAGATATTLVKSVLG